MQAPSAFSCGRTVSRSEAGGRARVLAALICAQVLVGCGDGSGRSPNDMVAHPPNSPPEAMPAAPPIEGHGRFIGTVTIQDVNYFGDALLTEDGELRLYVGGPGEATGALQVERPESAAQFVGRLDMHRRTSGNGVVISQHCETLGSDPLCVGTTPADIDVEEVSGGIVGEMRLAVNDEVWALSLHRWEYYYDFPAGPASGQYREHLAEFAHEGMAIGLGNGALSFKSTSSGCTGRGTLTPHLNGAFHVFDVRLHIEHCNEAHAFLNGEFEGLASETAGSVWDYDNWLRMWLSTPEGSSAPVAIATLASR